MVYGRHKSCF